MGGENASTVDARFLVALILERMRVQCIVLKKKDGRGDGTAAI
jgi:hypothetical protein